MVAGSVIVVPLSSTFNSSPFSGPRAAHAELIPVSLRDQYLSAADAPFDVVLGGRMDRIWHRPRWLWPVFWLLARGDILFPETGEGVPTTLVVRPGRDLHGAPIQTWERTFRFRRHRLRRFRSVMSFDESTGFVAEREGPRNVVEELAEVQFIPPTTIEFVSRRSAFVLGERRLRLPRRLWVTALVRQVADPVAGTSHVTLVVTHGTLGPVFGYEGTFRSVRRPRRDRPNSVRW